MAPADTPDPSRAPFAAAWTLYRDRGWPGIVPLGFRRAGPPEPRLKALPPAGYTGDDGAWPDRAQLELWALRHPDLNIGLRLPSDVVGIDVDQYVSARSGDLKLGAELLGRLEAEHGPLPPTWRSTSRGADNPSGVRLYRVPAGTRLRNAVPGGIEVIQRHHRYVCCWPSVHPDPDPETGELRIYRWYTPSGELADGPPAIDADDIPDLPWKWLEALPAEAPPEAARIPAADAQMAPPEEWSEKVTAYQVQALADLEAAAVGGRHDAACAAAMGLCRLEQLGSRGATTALGLYGQAFVARVAADRADHGRDNGALIAGREWEDIVTSGRRKAETTASTVASVGTLELPAPAAPRPDDQGPFISWPEFWSTDPVGEEWLIEGVIALGRAHVIYASHKQGKSLYTLWSAAKVAVERTDVNVIYLDYEMTRDDLHERLDDMGYGAESDLSRLHYALLPLLAPLDTAQGAAELCAIVDAVARPEMLTYVVVDTMGRAVEGEENSNDTTRNFYRHTGSMLKRMGVTWARLDHAGKDPSKGQRGGSAKGDDVDVVWKLKRTEGGMELLRDAARMSWVPEKVSFTIATDPHLSYVLCDQSYPAGTAEAAAVLDRAGVPLGATVRAARQVLKSAGEKVRNDRLSAALKWRRDPGNTVGNTPLVEGGGT